MPLRQFIVYLCSSAFILLYNKLPQTYRLKIALIYQLTVDQAGYSA